MQLFHGSLSPVVVPDFKLLNNKTDFGKGFYTTTDYDQAVKWTFVKKSRINSDKLIFRYVNEFEYNEDNDLNVLNFLTALEKWLDFVYANRKDDNFTHEYDVVMGPVADDTLYKVLDLYDSGVLTYKETIERLKTYKLSNQISFHTEKSLKYLKYICTYALEEDYE